MNRVIAVMRIYALNWFAITCWPWAILATAFAVNLAIFGVLGNQGHDPITGGLASIYCTMFIVVAALVSQYFPFLLGMGVTRRTFYIAVTSLTAGASVAFGIVLYACSRIERTTNGWGMRLHFFQLPFMGWHNPALQIAMYVVPFLVLNMIGLFGSVILKRWGVNGIFAALIVLLIVIGAAATIVTYGHGWNAIDDWFGDQSVPSLLAGWPLVAAGALGIGGYLAIRKATS